MLRKKVARRGKDGRGSTSVPHPMRGLRGMIIQERQTLCRHFLEHARQESEKKIPKLAIVNLGHVVRNFHDDEKNWIRLYEEAAEEQNSTGLLNELWMRELVMDDASQTVFFTFLPLYRSGSKAAGNKKHKVSRKTVCGGTWEVKAQEFTSTVLTGQKLRFTESGGKISMSMLEITLTESDPTRVSLCLVYKRSIESSAAFIMGPIENCLPQIPYLPHRIDYPTNQDQVQFTGQHNFLGAATDEKSSDSVDDSKSSLMYSEAPKNCTQMGIGNVAYSSSNIQSKSLRDYLVHAVSRHVDAYLQDYPLEAAKIPDQCEHDNKYIEGCVVHVLEGLGILPHIMESKYSVDENKRLGKRKVGPEGSSQVFEEDKKAHIYEEPNNIENNLMHDFSNRGTTYSIDPSGISQAPQTDVVTTQLSQEVPICTKRYDSSVDLQALGGNTSQSTVPETENHPELNPVIKHIKAGPTFTPVGYPQSGAPTNHAARGNEQQQQHAPSENLLGNEVFTTTQDPLDEVVQPFLPPLLQYPTIVATSPSNGLHDNDAVAQKGVLISTNQYDSSVESLFQQDLQAIGGNTTHTVPGQANLQPVPEYENPEMNAMIEELVRGMYIPTQDQVQHFPPVGINEEFVAYPLCETPKFRTGELGLQDLTTVLANSPSNGFPDNDAVPQKPPFPQDMRADEFATYEFPDDDYSLMQNQKDQSIWIRDGAGSGNNDKFEDPNDNDLKHFS